MEIALLAVLVVIAGLVILYQLIKVHRNQLPRDKTYPFAGAEMSYSVFGEGRSVILLHGSMISDPWKGFEKELAKSYKVYLPNLPGFGASDTVRGRLHNTELFAEALCAFTNEVKLKDAPIISFSLGTVVAIKAANKNCANGKLILVGMPAKVESEKLKKASLVPIWFRRLLGSTVWGRDKILIPIVRDVVGNTDKKRDDELLQDLAVTDTKSLVDLNAYEEIELQMPDQIKSLKNEAVYIYGSRDKLLMSAKDLVKNPIIIEGAGHNVFKSQPQKLLELLRVNL